MKATTLRAALAAGASVILRGHGRAYSPGATAFRLAARAERGIDPPGLAGYFVAVVWRDGEGWKPTTSFRGPWPGLNEDEIVSVVE